MCAAFIAERDFKISALKTTEWSLLLLFGALNFVGYTAFILAISKIPVVQFQLVGVVVPLITGVLAVYFLKEPFHARYLIGFAFVAVGLFIALKS